MRTRLFFAGGMLLIGFLFFGCGQPQEDGGQIDSQSANSVQDGEKSGLATLEKITLEIDFNSEREKRVLQVPCSGSSTVISILESARTAGDMAFVSTGSGDTAFVKSIDGVKNEGATGNNWFYLVNYEPGDRSCGAYSVKPGDHILWVHGDYP